MRLAPYLCPSGVPTIGWGSTIYENGTKVTMKDRSITRDRADMLFAFHLNLFEKDVNSLVYTAKLTQAQFDALVSFSYNVGTDIDQDSIPEGLGDSTLLKKILSNPLDPTITREFLKWNKSKGVVNAGLIARRNHEAQMYFGK